jgi:hypothetical protein
MRPRSARFSRTTEFRPKEALLGDVQIKAGIFASGSPEGSRSCEADAVAEAEIAYTSEDS